MLEVRGFFRVNKVRVIHTNIQYMLLFLKDRILFLKVGGQFADISKKGAVGMVAGAAVAGPVGAVVGYRGAQLAKETEEKIKSLLDSLGDRSADELLGMDKNNFQIAYSDISRIEMKKSALRVSLSGPMIGTLSIEVGGRKKRFEIAPRQGFDECRDVIASCLPDKLR